MTQTSNGLIIAAVMVGLCGCSGPGVGERGPQPPRESSPLGSQAAPSSSEMRLLMRMWDGTEIGNRGTVREGDLFELLVRLDGPAYVYVVQFYAESSAVLYPAPGQQRVDGPGLIRLPNRPEQWWHVVGSPGEETLYVLISGAPMSRVDEYIAATLDTVRRSPGARVAGRDDRPAGAGAEAAGAALSSPREPAPASGGAPREISPESGGKGGAGDGRAATSHRESLEARGTKPSGAAGKAGRDDFPGDTSVLTRAVEITTAYDVDAESAEQSVAILHVTFLHRHGPGVGPDSRSER